MDTCTNCGATLRPGAKFCTNCGTRMNDKPATTPGWETTDTPSADDTQQTTVLDTVKPSPEPADSPEINQSWQRSPDPWKAAYAAESQSTPPATSSDDPASRFISALDDDVKPAPEVEEESGLQDKSISTWETTAPAFTPSAASTWNYNASDKTEPEVEADETEVTSEADQAEGADTHTDSTWEAPSTWNAVLETSEPDVAETPDVDSARFTEGGTDEVDYLSGDENIEIAGESTPELSPDDARAKAIELADELRRTIRMMSGPGESDHGAAVMALTEASLNVGDFSDLRGVLVDVKNDPRDIQTLGNLAGKVDRIEALMDEHKALNDAIETAIKELNGY